MKQSIFTISLLFMVLALSSCGGGGGEPNPIREPDNSLRITISPVVTSLPANTLGWPDFIGSPFETQVDVRVTFANGQGVSTGLITHMQTDNSAVAYVGIPDDPSTTVNEYDQGYTGANQETIGSNATYFIRSGTTVGTAIFTINATHPTTGRNFEKMLTFTINEGPDQTVQQLSLVSPRDTMPVNSNNVEFFNGTPFMVEADIQVRDIFGNLTEPGLGGTTSGSSGRPVVKASVTPSSLVYLTKNDDVSTEINEFLTEITPTEVVITAGHGNLYIWSKNIPGTATITLSTIEAGSGFELSTSFQIEVVGNDISVPTDIAVSSDAGGLYVVGSGGDTTKNLQINVTNGDAPVLDPQVNNVQLSISTNGPDSGESIKGTNVNGNSVQGNTIKVSTISGITSAILSAGSSQNTITVTAVADGLDNNVDNGIQQAITHIQTFVVSDGVLWALELTSSQLDVLTVNGQDDENGVIEYQDGTYSLKISAIATDKAGNPALSQTLSFGMLNSPIIGYPDNGSGTFVHSSNDGNPHEGAQLFDSISGRFITAAGGVQPNDTLVVFGEESLGNEDLESAVTVASVISQKRVSIIERFNRNDETGTIDNDLGVLPYAIGRAVDGNIIATAVIDEQGVATSTLNYPVSQLGRIAAIYVTGQGAVNRVVTDVELMTFPGSEGFNGQTSTLVVSPSIIPGNVNNIDFIVCLADSASNPLPGRSISFNYAGTNGLGTIDGQINSGVLIQPTGTNGCATGVVSTSGVQPGNNDHSLGFNFFAGTLTCSTEQNTCMEVVPSENGVLNANPSAFAFSGSHTIILTLYDGSGIPITGVPLQGDCTSNGGSLGITGGPSITDENGQSTVVVQASLDGTNQSHSGSCSFSTPSGDPSVDVSFNGRDICLAGVSPLPSGCTGSVDQYQAGGQVTGLTSAGPLVIENNNADSITLTSNTTFLFPAQDDGSVYLISVDTQPPGQTCTVTNGAGTLSANVTNVTVTCI